MSNINYWQYSVQYFVSFHFQLIIIIHIPMNISFCLVMEFLSTHLHMKYKPSFFHFSFFHFFCWGRLALSQHLLPIFLILLEEDCHWANIHCQFSSILYVGHHHSMAWWVVCRSATGIQPCELQATDAECTNFTTPLGWLWQTLFKM